MQLLLQHLCSSYDNPKCSSYINHNCSTYNNNCSSYDNQNSSSFNNHNSSSYNNQCSFFNKHISEDNNCSFYSNKHSSYYDNHNCCSDYNSRSSYIHYNCSNYNDHYKGIYFNNHNSSFYTNHNSSSCDNHNSTSYNNHNSSSCDNHRCSSYYNNCHSYDHYNCSTYYDNHNNRSYYNNFSSYNNNLTSTTRFGTVMFFVRLMFQLNTPVPTKDDVLGVVDKQLYLQFNNQTNTQTTFQNGTYIKLTDTSFAVDLGFKITNVTMESQSNSLTFTNETYSQIEDSINSLLHDILCKPDGKQFDFPKPNFTTVGTQIRADVMYVYKKEDINLPSAFLEEVLKVSGMLLLLLFLFVITVSYQTPYLLPTTVAPTTTTTTVASTTAIKTAGPTTTTTIAAPTMTTTAASTSTTTIVLPTLTTTTATFTSTSMASVTATTRFGTVMFFVRLMFQLNTPVPTKDDVLGAVDKQLYRQFNNQTNTQTTFQNGTYIKLTDTSFAVDLGFKITNVTMESQSNSLTFTNETYSQIEDSINSLLHDILCKPDGKQFDFPKPNFTTVGTQIRADVMYVYKKEDINLPSAFLEEVLKVSGMLLLLLFLFVITVSYQTPYLLPTTVAPTTTTTTVASTTAIKTAGPTTTTTIAAPTMTTTAASTSTTTIVLPTLTTTTATFTSTSMASVTATTRFGTVMFFVRLMFQLNTPVPTKDDVLGVVDKQLYLQFNNQTNTQTTFQNGTYIKLTDTSFAVDLGFKITNVTMESQSNSLTFTNETYSQIEDSINSLLHDILCKPDGKQFDFPKPNFTTVGTQIRADVMYVYKKEDINLPSAFLEEVLKVSGMLLLLLFLSPANHCCPNNHHHHCGFYYGN
ncbi:uncharacterized protein LOC121585295 [Coregonus clupeaformis]|uniref:uncharacterized protein LOC121585295 n=1 Tax=Coregonus clupeaformis TaxID=59861 RepID=UPI001E1C5695|nr:uncharacterized protein LOC121585295 [Coregonus clupeaformis]